MNTISQLNRNIMIKSILSLCFFLWCIVLHAQPSIQWQRTFGGTDTDHANSIHQTTDGGYFVTGISISNNGDVFGNHGGVDVWVLKLDSLGEIQWKKTYGGSSDDRSHSAKQTNDGGYIIAGHTYSNNWDVSGNHGSYDAWVLKLSSNGIIQWQKCFGGSNLDEAWDIKQTLDDGYIVIGGSNSTDGDLSFNHGSRDFWVVKLDNSGSIEWQKSLGGSGSDIGYAIGLTSDGGYIINGEVGSNDGQVSGFHGGTDFWVVKLNFEGKIEWEKALGGTGLDRGNDIHQTRDGGYIAFGQTRSSNGDVTGQHGAYDQWAVKLDISGNIEWQKALGGSSEEFATKIYQTSDNGYVMVGQTQSTDGDVIGNDGGADIWIVKVSELGDVQWQKAIGGTQGEWGNSISQTTDGGYIVAGYSWSTNGDLTENKGKTDLWIVKLAPESTPTSTPATQPLNIFPNPASEAITISVPREDPSLSLGIIDLLGREIHRQTLPNGGSADISNLPNGLYLLTATTPSGRVFSGKLRKQE